MPVVSTPIPRDNIATSSVPPIQMLDLGPVATSDLLTRPSEADHDPDARPVGLIRCSTDECDELAGSRNLLADRVSK